MQALSSFQCEAKAPEQSGVATLLKICVFLQFSSTSVKWAEKYSLEEQQKRQPPPSFYSSRVRTTIETLQAKNSRKQPKLNNQNLTKSKVLCFDLY